MAPQVPLGEPSTVAAGDTWLWQQSFPDYPASEGWSISYRFRGANVLDSQAGEITYSGATASVVIAATSTAPLTPGTYYWQAIATGSGSYAGRVHSAGSGVLEVTQNLDLAKEGDALTWEERTLPVVEAALSGKVTDDMASYMIGGRQVVTIPLNELRALRTSLRREIARQRGRPHQMHLVTLP